MDIAFSVLPTNSSMIAGPSPLGGPLSNKGISQNLLYGLEKMALSASQTFSCYSGILGYALNALSKRQAF
jgi:hypothetical protein